MEIRFGICDRVWYFNTAECRVMPAVVKSVRVLPTGMSKGTDGEDVLDGYVVLYETMDGPVLSEQECFGSELECLGHYREFFADRGASA